MSQSERITTTINITSKTGDAMEKDHGSEVIELVGTEKFGELQEDVVPSLLSFNKRKWNKPTDVAPTSATKLTVVVTAKGDAAERPFGWDLTMTYHNLASPQAGEALVGALRQVLASGRAKHHRGRQEGRPGRR